jgi:hypothetical protein
MFSNDENAYAWMRLAKLAKQDDFKAFTSLLRAVMPEFRNSIDDLRLLFYIGAKMEKTYFMHALSYFDTWPASPPENAEYRISVFLYAIENSIPERERERRIYMREEFCKKMGITPPAIS